MAKQKDGLSSYKETNISTANRGKLLIMLYEAAINHMKDSLLLMDDFKNYDTLNNKLKKVLDIIEELLGSLNKKESPQLAERLESIYLFCFDQVFLANSKKDKEVLNGVVRIFEDLLGAWKVAVEQENENLDKEMKSSRFSVKS